nr:MAG TPA: hypothetical protein [Caudoviricetes sp.]
MDKYRLYNDVCRYILILILLGGLIAEVTHC